MCVVFSNSFSIKENMVIRPVGFILLFHISNVKKITRQALKVYFFGREGGGGRVGGIDNTDWVGLGWYSVSINRAAPYQFVPLFIACKTAPANYRG